jgi:mono/diheme cytochrome c family protein
MLHSSGLLPSRAASVGLALAAALILLIGTAHAGREHAASLPMPPGVTQAQVALGARIFHGEVSGGICSGCHGSDGKGSPVGADLTSGTWLWSDGSLAGIQKSIADGIPTPKKHGGAMPPMGGVPLSAADLQAVSAYVWALGHSSRK